MVYSLLPSWKVWELQFWFFLYNSENLLCSYGKKIQEEEQSPQCIRPGSKLMEKGDEIWIYCIFWQESILFPISQSWAEQLSDAWFLFHIQ